MKHISWYLVIAMCILAVAPRVDAGIAPSEIVAFTHADRDADLGKIQKVLEIKAVGERLKQFGLTTEEVQQRLKQMNDQQVHQLALQLDELKVGQSDALGVIIALLVIVILVIVILKLTGHKVIVT
jgi:hypothetical protein